MGELEDKPVTYISAGRNHTVAITDQHALYSWGHNSFGQLGLGHRTTKQRPNKVNEMTNFHIL